MRAIAKQIGFFEVNKHAARRVTPPFCVDACEMTAPGYHRVFWRLLSYRSPTVPALCWNGMVWHPEGIIRDETRHLDIHLIADEAGNLREATEKT